MEKVKKKYNKKGFISIYTILWIIVLLPLLMFVTIDFTHFMHVNNQLKNLTDNLSASAVTLLDEDEIPKGILTVKESDAEDMVNKMLKDELKLKDDLTPTDKSILRSAPDVEVKVVNEVPSAGIDVSLETGDIVNVKNPSVIVSVDYPIRGLFYNKLTIHYKKIGTSQVQFLNK